MKLEKTPGGYALYKEKTIIGTCQARPTEQGADITALTIVPEWRRKGYGSYLLKAVSYTHLATPAAACST